jgi:hypothetical protein
MFYLWRYTGKENFGRLVGCSEDLSALTALMRSDQQPGELVVTAHYSYRGEPRPIVTRIQAGAIVC